MSEFAYSNIKVSPKSGREPFATSGTALPFDLRSFWQWSASDLVSNATRGVLAEYLVAKALDLRTTVRAEWDDYDLETNDGLAIEVKSAAYLQTWHQEQLSTISFGIAPTKGWDGKSARHTSKYERRSDIYIFCLLETKDQEKLNPMALDQWIFYVLLTEVLDEQLPTQKNIGLNSLLKLAPSECRFEDLKKAVAKLGADFE